MESNESTKNIFNCDLGFIGNAEFKKDDKIIKTRIYSIRLGRVFDQITNKNTTDKLKIIKKIFKLNRLNDLTHTITGLYDTSLPDIGARPIYECVCSVKAYTICVIKDDQDPFEGDLNLDDYSNDDCLSTVEDSIPENESIFENLFSESSEDEDDDDEDDEENDDIDIHTKGLKSFLENNKIKKSQIVKNLIACATLERVSTFQLPGQDEWVIDLQLMAVRDKYRGYSIGKHLINLIQNKDLVGNYDAIVTCSDNNAIQFYEKYAFSNDSILNSKYSHIGDIWTDSTKMCFIPPYVSSNEKIKLKTLIKDLESAEEIDCDIEYLSVKDSTEEKEMDHSEFIAELTSMERDFKRWQKLMFSSYQNQSKLFYKFKQEILSLKANLCAKNSLIDELRIKNDMLTKNNKLLQLKINDLELKNEYSQLNEAVNNNNNPNRSIEQLVNDLENLSN